MSSFFSQPFVADPNEAASDSSYTAIPEGVYDLMVNKVKLGLSKSYGREQIAIELVVESGDFEGRKIFKYISLENPDENKLKRSKRELHALVILCGLKRIENDPAELEGKSFKNEVKCKRDDATGQIKNEVWFDLPNPEGKSTPAATKTEAKSATKKAW